MKTEKPIADSYHDQIALLNPEKPVRVYRNLNRSFYGEEGFWSVKQGVVRFHCREICLRDVTFPVNERVRLEVVRNKVKQVHAYVQGFICYHLDSFDTSYEVTYDPYKGDKFTSRLGKVKSAERCRLLKRHDGKMRVYASGILTEQVAPVMIDVVPVHLL
jgi:hypothetical protein